MMAKPFQPSVEIFFWHDGDTFYGIVDRGNGDYKGKHSKLARVRMARIQAPELVDPGGIEATKFADSLAPAGEYCCVPYGLDNYGRPLVDLILPMGRLFSTEMITAGHAKVYK